MSNRRITDSGKGVRARRPGLTRQRIAAAAVDLVDREGLERFGVRRLAMDIGVDPMSIYNHIPGKDGLLDAICEYVLTEAASLASAEQLTDWRELARRIAHDYRAMGVRHPRVFPLVATRSQQSPPALSVLEQLAAAMKHAGLSGQVIADAPLALFGFVNGYLLATLTPGNPTIESVLGALDPAITPVMASLAPYQADFGTLDQFDRMVEIVLAGISQRGSRAG